MALSARLQMRQSQSLVMTPQLLQSIRLLQYSQAELASFLEAEIERNPLLERHAATEGESVVGPAAGAWGNGADPAGDGDHASAPDGRGLAGGSTDAGDSRFEAVDGLGARPGHGREAAGGLAGSGTEFPIEAVADRKPSLAAHALAEIADALSDPMERKLAEAIVEHLDETGYLRIDLAETAEALGVATETLEMILATLQKSVEPAGLFARSLAECLALQLRRRNRFDPVIACVLDNLDLLARRDFAGLRRLTGEDQESLTEILAEIRRLDPKPGHAFDAGEGGAVVPEILVSEAADGGWRVELNPETLPRLLVHDRYAEHIARGALTADETVWLGECRQTANWLVRSLDQRARTMMKVAAEIVRRQDGFLTRGVGGLKPMTLMSVAEAIGMHESTVSRVTSGKYVATPRGTFEMKFFFTVAISSSSGGDAHSAESVKLRIRTMIAAETTDGVLSDDDIAARLKAEGVDLARRTVAKYREALGLASSIQRRREMKARRLAS